MIRWVVLAFVVFVCTAAPALAQQPIPCSPGASGAPTPAALQTLFGATGSDKLVFLEDRIRMTGLIDLPVPCQAGTRISADIVEIFYKGGILHASGNVVFADPEGRLSADEVDFDPGTGIGTFRRASGIVSLGPTVSRAQFGNQDPDVYFHGELIERIGARRYRITRGGFTTCVQPEPRWEVVSGTVEINLNEYAVARDVVFRVKGVPLMYLPILYYPISEQQRSTGILMPTYGTSTLRGSSISNAFFWAINRSQDATFFHDWYTRVGQGMGAEYRYVSSGISSGTARIYRFGQQETVFDQGGTSQILPSQTSYLLNSAVSQQLGSSMRAQGRVEYFTDVQTGQLYYRDPYSSTQSRRVIDGGVTGNFGPATVGGYYSRSEIFTDARNSTVAGTLPRASLNVTPTPLFGAPIYGGIAAEYAYLANQRRTDGIVQIDDSLGRLDLAPSIRAPLSRLTYLSTVVTAAYRRTYYSRSLDETSRLGQEPITRQFLSLQTQVVGPVLTKIWDTPGSTYSARKKHVIEPAFWFDYITEIANQARVPAVDSAGVAFGGAMRFTYGVTNRLFARKPDVNGTRGLTREFVTIGVQQTYYSDRRASSFDTAYTSYAIRPRPVDLSPVALTVRVSPVDGIESSGRVEYDVSGNGLQVLAAGAGVIRSGRVASASFSRQRATPLSDVSSYIGGSATLPFVQGRVNTTFSLSWDVDAGFIQSQTAGLAYYAQCCGFTADYQQVNFPRSGGFPIPSDRRMNFAFVLAGLGTFSNFFGAFGGQP